MGKGSNQNKCERDTMNTICTKYGSSKYCNAVIETYFTKRLEANREKEKGETYTVKDHTILDINWGQYTEVRPGEIHKGKEKAGKTLKKMMKEGKIHSNCTLQIPLVVYSHRQHKEETKRLRLRNMNWR